MLLALAGLAFGGEIVVTELGNDERQNNPSQDWAYKLNILAVHNTSRLTTVAPWLLFTPGTKGGDGVMYAVYEELGTDEWSLVWVTPILPTGDDADFQPSPVPSPEILLQAGRRYAVGFILEAGNYTYEYDANQTGGDHGWFTHEGAIYTGSDYVYSTPTLIEQTPTDTAYHMELTVEVLDADGDGATEDVDCDDADPLNWPGAPELCDGVDNDCTGVADDPVDYQDWFRDADGDGYGDEGDVESVCDGSRPDGRIAQGGDCDDGADRVHPGVDEYCDGVDDDCSGVVDDDPITNQAFEDLDGDGVGGEATTYCTRERPAELVVSGGDCADDDALAFPGAAERCNGQDDNCDRRSDEGLPSTTVFADADGDGFGDRQAPVTTCDPAADGFVTNPLDCDDTRAERAPDQEEVCDGLDNDCDGLAGGESDYDEDGALDCADCAAADPSVFPGATEQCDGVDHDCDGVAKQPIECDPAPTEQLSFSSCGGCASSTGPGGWLVLLPALFAARRRLAHARSNLHGRDALPSPTPIG